nr:DUF6694 family lipoprotein [Microbulbifer sp. ALW1]
MALALTACGDPKVDGSSEEAFKESMAKVVASLPASEHEKFSGAVMTLMMGGQDFFKLAAMGEAGADQMEIQARAKMNGKTADEILAMAEELQRKLKAKQEKEEAEEEQRRKEQAARDAERKRQQALEELQALEADMAKAEAAAADLGKFQVLNARYYEKVTKSDFYTHRSKTIEITVRNGTDKPVSRAYFKGTLASQGRSVPWAVDTFNYEIPGGLEPGEKATWKLMGDYSDFARADAPGDAVLTVVVERLDGADGEPIADARVFDERKAERLTELQATLASTGAGNG